MSLKHYWVLVICFYDFRYLPIYDLLRVTHLVLFLFSGTKKRGDINKLVVCFCTRLEYFSHLSCRPPPMRHGLWLNESFSFEQGKRRICSFTLRFSVSYLSWEQKERKRICGQRRERERKFLLRENEGKSKRNERIRRIIMTGEYVLYGGPNLPNQNYGTEDWMKSWDQLWR